MKFIKSLNPKTVKKILIINLLFLLGYSIFIFIFDHDLIIRAITSKTIFFEYVGFKIILGILFFISSLLVYKIEKEKKWLWIIIGSGLIVRLIFIPAYPVIEDDYYRYLWDGAVTANGINPYKYSPKEALEGSSEREVPAVLNKLANESGEIVRKINHPHIRTIYPPAAQIVFAVCYFIFPWKIWGWKIFILLFDATSLLLFYKLLRKYNKPLIFIFFYWLNPIIIHEFYAGAHMDVLLFPVLLLVLYFAVNNSNLFSSIFISLAVGIKLWPAVFVPLVFRNLWNDKKKLVIYLFLTAAFALLIFIPVLVTVFDRSLGFVVYAQSWTNNEAVFKILHSIMKEVRSIFEIYSMSSFQLTRWVSGIFYVIFILFISRKRFEKPQDYFNKFLLVPAVLFFISPTQFPWYFSWVIPFLVFRPMVSLLLYPVLLPLYQLNYISPYFVYLQHIPILILFLYELKTKRWENLFGVD